MVKVSSGCKGERSERGREVVDWMIEINPKIEKGERGWKVV
jgi:hypothetical protein